MARVYAVVYVFMLNTDGGKESTYLVPGTRTFLPGTGIILARTCN